MKFNEPFDYKGYWWKPNDPDNKVAGVLTYKPSESIILELIGTFDTEKDAVGAFLNMSEESVIHGALENGKSVTLLNCHPSGSVNFSSFFPIIRYTCIYCFIGRHYTGLDEEGGFRMAIHFPELSYWCHPGIVRETFRENKENKTHAFSLSFETIFGGKTLADVELDDGFKIQIKAGASLCGDHGKLNNQIGQSSWVEISRNQKVSFKKLLSHVSKFQDFLSIATLSIVEASEISFYDENYYQELEIGEKIYHTIDFFSSHWRKKDKDKIERIDFLFSYDIIKGKFEELIRSWYADKNDMYPVRGNLIDSLEKKRVFSNIDFLTLVRALDGYCIRSRCQGSIAKRMEMVVEKFSDIQRIKIDHINIEELVDSRDYYAHFMPRARKKHVLDGFRLHDLTQKVRRLIICCVLSDLGFDNLTIDNIFKKSNSRYINQY